MDRKDVYNAIDGERDYQDSMGPERTTQDSVLSQAEMMSIMRVYIRDAEYIWYKNPGVSLPEVSDLFRKIAALCVQDGERNGMPSRKLIKKD